MTHLPESMLAGYRSFMTGRYTSESTRYRTLAREGQAPEIMVIACCDSRAAPETIFDCGPGELFVVRNVANLVPPYTPDGATRAVSAALEFAVQALKVKHIVVLGHELCGGIRAYAEHLKPLSPGDFIGKWMELLRPAADRLGPRGAMPLVDYLTRLEQASLEKSLENLMTFPCIRILAERGRLTLHAAYFGVASGKLSVRNPATGVFEPVAAGEHARTLARPQF